MCSEESHDFLVRVVRESFSPKVEGHADQFMVADGSVRQEDLVGNDGADTAADLGSLRQNVV